MGGMGFPRSLSSRLSIAQIRSPCFGTDLYYTMILELAIRRGPEGCFG